MQQQSSSPSGRPRASRLIPYLFATLAFAGAGMLTPACGGGGGGAGGAGGDGGAAGSAGSTGTDDCVGGVIVNGVCEGKCKPELCGFADNTCVGNRCMLKCDSQKDCYQDGSQSCVSVKEDDTNADITVCQFTGKPAGTGIGCPFGGECAPWMACPDGGTCFSTQCAGMPNACVRDEAVCGTDEACVFGKCPDGAPCRVDCMTTCKPWLECQTTGEADADAYCTSRDCATDDDCLGGYYCGTIRDPHEICESNPKKGDNNFCGQTTEPCIAVGPDGKATDGTSRFEGSLCMQRRSCLKRGPGAPCATDIDCSQIEGQVCATLAGETRCARRCSTNTDCELDHQCDAVAGGAKGGACVPRFGMWQGKGQGFCEPCYSDEDCGSKGTAWACSGLSGTMRACFDQSFPDTCTTNLDCPTSPSGKHGTCLDESFGVAPGDGNYHRCYLPINTTTNKTTCW